MASYNCSDSNSSAYGGGNYGTCAEQSIGAPSTGFFSQLTDSGSFTIIAPLLGAIVVVLTITVLVKARRRRSNS